jgi:hypothetical protein
MEVMEMETATHHQPRQEEVAQVLLVREVMGTETEIAPKASLLAQPLKEKWQEQVVAPTSTVSCTRTRTTMLGK